MCKYCEGNVDEREDLMDGIYVDANGNLTNDIELDDVKINYCPMCGRKLSEV